MSQKFPTARTVRVDELIELYTGIIDSVEDQLKSQGVSSTLPKPDNLDVLEGVVRYAENGDPLLPRDVTELSGLQIGQLYSLFTNWANYLSSLASRGKANEVVLGKTVKVIESALSAYYRDEVGVPASRVKEKITLDIRYSHADANYLSNKKQTIHYESRLGDVKRSLNRISREQTRRRDELEQQLHDERGGKVNNERGFRKSGVDIDRSFR